MRRWDGEKCVCLRQKKETFDSFTYEIDEEQQDIIVLGISSVMLWCVDETKNR